MNSDESFLKKLETELETGVQTTEDRRGIFHREKVPTVPTDWEEKTVSEQQRNDLYDGLEIKRAKQKSLFKKMFLLSCVFAVVSGGIFLYSLFNGKARLTGENVVVNLSTKAFADSGEEVTVRVMVGNENPIPMEYTKIRFNYPIGSTRDAQAQKEIARDLGTINPGELREETFAITLFGEQGSEKVLSAIVEYQLQDSNAVYEKIGTTEVLLRSSVANLIVTGSEKVLSGQRVPLQLIISGNATSSVENLLLVTDYAEGCSYSESTTDPTLDKNIWYIGKIAPGADYNLSVGVTCIGNTDEEKIIKFTLGNQDVANERLIQTVYTSSNHTVRLTTPFLSTALAVNGRPYTSTTSLAGNRDASFDITFKNNETVPITDAKVFVALSGSGLDETRIRSGSGFYDSTQKTIIWSKNELAQLASIPPGGTGTLGFQLTPRLLSDSGTIEVSISVEGVVGVIQQELVNAVTATIPLVTNLELLPKTLHHSGLLKNTGSMPMRAGSETTFTMVWSLANSINPVTNAVVKTTLPTGIVWKNVTAPANQSSLIQYNTVTREITWSPGNIAKGQELPSVSFMLGVTPSNTQIGTVINLTTDMTLTATDTVTGTPLVQTKRAQTTRLPNDSSKIGEDGKVLAP
jgi:hypothetical protein